MNAQDFKPGQDVAIVDFAVWQTPNIISAVVTKVGAECVFAKAAADNRERNFVVSGRDGAFLEELKAPPRHYLFPSVEAARDYFERQDLVAWLMQALEWRRRQTYTLGQLRAVKAILEPGVD